MNYSLLNKVLYVLMIYSIVSGIISLGLYGYYGSSDILNYILEDAKVISQDSYLSSCKLENSNPYVCFKPHLMLEIKDTNELCSFVDDVSSTDMMLVNDYMLLYMPVNSTQKIYKNGGNLNGVTNCKIASNHFQHTQEKFKETKKIVRNISTSSIIMSVFVFVLHTFISKKLNRGNNTTTLSSQPQLSNV